MAEVFAPFIINRTIGNLTFYYMEGRNFVRKKSSLTRRKVLYAPQFKRTRYNAGLMAKASKLGSRVYNALPAYWRQGWMYRAFTGEAYTMIKAGKKEHEIQQVLLQRYVEPVINKQPEKANITSLNRQPKRTYRKQDSTYWKNKTIKSCRRKANKQRLLYNATLLGRASRIGSKLYTHIASRYRCRRYFQQLTAWAMQLLKDEWDESDIITALLPDLKSLQPENHRQSTCQKNAAGLVIHPDKRYYFIISPNKRTDVRQSLQQPVSSINPQLVREIRANKQKVRHFSISTCTLIAQNDTPIG